MDAALRLMAEPRREEILRLVWSRERSAGEIAAALPVSFPAVSQHLRRMREAGLVRVRRDGRRRIYAARREALGPLAAHYEELWGAGLARLRDVAEREERSGGSR